MASVSSQEGEVWGQRRVDEAKTLLAQVGMDADRLELHYVSGLELDGFNRALAVFKEGIRNLSVTAE